jgi:hypothetical protein
LYEGSYHIGAAALLNSLHLSGFDGVVVCGHRGPLPPWAEQVAALRPITVEFVPIERPEHLTYLKPWFMLAELRRLSEVDRVVYLDPDIVVKCTWDYVETWMDAGVAGVEDVNGRVPDRHPMRTQWRRWLGEQGWQVHSPRNVYINAGFVGAPRQYESLIEEWWEIVSRSGAGSNGLTSMKNGSPNDLFYSADQDALNMALEVVDCPLSWMGGEGMDFAPGGSVLSHATGLAKPWQGRALRRALAGAGPTPAYVAFFRFVSGPLEVVSRADRRRLMADLRAAQAVSRIWRRA